ncbi:hypothetical protein F9U64_01885 [Gracilibacillus oryzae]|uniref:Uncharacterized protein n=1 Tax=Gracilibacillus oryzae TaxID=1672701 RepID=A0A7C8GW05_9BACI|nr:hypothetical protein [Gracilibacillus oryzae]KAB8139164.1 hypothetical protein F9U64_01885 [Gracilibacillus oryzae]
MGKVIDSLWHKLALLGLMIYYSGIFTTIYLPMMWLHYSIPAIDYYIFSLGILFSGGLIFNVILNIYPIKEEELEECIPKYIVIRAFAGKFIAYIVLSLVILVLTDNFILSVYNLLFLLAGGFFWFCILRGYILAKNDYKESELDKGITWQGRVMVFSIPISLILGYFMLR